MNKEIREQWRKDFRRKKLTIDKQEKIQSSISKWKDVSGIIQSIFTVLGIIGALWWFYGQGEYRPRAIVSHEIKHREIDGKLTWVFVSVKIKNIGKVPINIKSGKVWIQRIKPLRQDLNEEIIFDGCVVRWPRACYHYKYVLDQELNIEPNEIDSKSYEYIISQDIITIKVYSYFNNPIKSWKPWKEDESIGWEEVSVYDLKG